MPAPAWPSFVVPAARHTQPQPQQQQWLPPAPAPQALPKRPGARSRAPRVIVSSSSSSTRNPHTRRTPRVAASTTSVYQDASSCW